MVERSIKAKKQSKAREFLLDEARDQIERNQMEIRIINIQIHSSILLSHSKAESHLLQVKSAKSLRATPPRENTPVDQRNQPAVKLTSLNTAPTPENRTVTKTSSYTGKNHRSRSTAALPSRQVSYFSALDRNQSSLNSSEYKATVFEKCHAVK